MDRMRPGLIQRAFELARSGRFTTITQIDAALRAEKYDAVPAQLSGAGIRTELRAIMRGGRAAADVRARSPALNDGPSPRDSSINSSNSADA
jgi:hypothetical protein